MRRLATTALLLLTGLLPACGGGDGGGAAATPTKSGTTTPTAAAAGLDDDAVLLVHDELVTCAQKEDALGLVAHLSGARAVSDTEGVGGGEYDDHLAAPKATAALVRSGAAQFVGLRADTRHQSGTSDIDVLIFRSEDKAAQAAKLLARESGGRAEPSGPFVNVTLRAAEGAESSALEHCEEEARP